ncbi:hypothetical protein M378DRAFT_162462 [Amanita muscaria Koide BX008]|uniref:Uncharacterized protein n=1 Tax=Amanita muscaria (strain Koide BX008) TaxID=946122 RepID=A0A0C2WTX1_AMAMK|nr:hypothetical protein M378DRAFT_162462 [Amanita muscaria Koide BX008]
MSALCMDNRLFSDAKTFTIAAARCASTLPGCAISFIVFTVQPLLYRSTNSFSTGTANCASCYINNSLQCAGS